MVVLHYCVHIGRCSYTSRMTCQRELSTECRVTCAILNFCKLLGCVNVLYMHVGFTIFQQNTIVHCPTSVFSHSQTRNDNNLTGAARRIVPPNTVYLPSASSTAAWWETELTSEANQWIGGIEQKFLCPCCRFDLCQCCWGSSWWSVMLKMCLIGLN